MVVAPSNVEQTSFASFGQALTIEELEFQKEMIFANKNWNFG